jgi:hypothetical protein
MRRRDFNRNENLSHNSCPKPNNAGAAPTFPATREEKETANPLKISARRPNRRRRAKKKPGLPAGLSHFD